MRGLGRAGLLSTAASRLDRERQAGATRGDARERAEGRAEGGRPQAALAPGGQKGRSPQSSARASDAGKCPHPGNLQRSTAAATPSGRQNGGGDGGLVLRGEPGPRAPRDGPRWPVAAPPASLPALPLRRYLGSLGGAPTASAPALWPAVAVQETRSVAGRSGAGVTGGAHSLHRSPSWRGGGRPGPRPSPLAGLQGLLRTGGPTRPGAGLTWLVAWT